MGWCPARWSMCAALDRGRICLNKEVQKEVVQEVVQDA